MTKNKLEKLFSESMHSDKELWGMKLISNPLTHQNTPADYIIDYVLSIPVPGKDITDEFTIHRHLKLILVECKLVTLDEADKGRLVFKRLKQMHDLINFENIRPDFHRSYFCIAFWAGRWDTSDIYMVPASVMLRTVGLFSERLRKVSINREDMNTHLGKYQIHLINGLINLNCLKLY